MDLTVLAFYSAVRPALPCLPPTPLFPLLPSVFKSFEKSIKNMLPSANMRARVGSQQDQSAPGHFALIGLLI